MNTSVKLWDRESKIPSKLRQPKMPLSFFRNTIKVEESIIETTKLSAEAKEWYPKNVVPQTSNVFNIQNRLPIYKNSVDPTDEFCDSTDMHRLRQIITTLTNDPGQFDDLYGIFMETLYPFLDDAITVPNCAHMLVDQAVNFPNFRYTGARLCCKIEQVFPTLQATLHLTCSKFLEQCPNKQNILLFIAELYTQLHHVNIYGNLLIESFKKFLAHGGSDNVKCICQALKLTGYSLELCDKEAMDELFELLQNVKNSVSGSAAILLDSVFNLRNCNWGRTPQTDASSSPREEDIYIYNDGENAIHYQLEGQTFTSEEQEFLSAHVNSSDDILSDSDPDELCDPDPEMDEEIQAAFKEFVKFSKGYFNSPYGIRFSKIMPLYRL